MLERPGFGLPLETYFASGDSKNRLRTGLFPSPVAAWASNTPTVRERAMFAFINTVTEKPNWWDKVNDEAIVAKWKQELQELVKAHTPAEEEVQIADDDLENGNEGNAAAATSATPEAAAVDDEEDEDDEERNDEDDAASENDYENGDDNDEDGDNADGSDNDDNDGEVNDDDGDDDDSNGGDDDGDSDSEMSILSTVPSECFFKNDNPDPPPHPFSQGFSDAMFDFCIKELRDKAEVYKKTGIVSVFDGATAVFRSDTAVSSEVRDALREAVKPLEDVPDSEKDWHPGSDEKVLDLVHPSLWPLVYGKTRILADRELTLADCMAAYGSGETIPVPAAPLKTSANQFEAIFSRRLFSTKFQWLPAEVDVSGPAKIKSYINNLPPATHKDLYAVIEKVIDASLPMWSAAYDRTMTWNAILEDPNTAPEYGKENHRMVRSRIRALEADRRCGTPKVCKGECSPENRPGRPTDEEIEAMEDDETLSEDPWEMVENADNKWFEATHKIIYPEPIDYTFIGHKDYKSTGPWFAPHTDTTRLQVIVKLANIELTPEKPSYPGGSWHTEGQLNERICATALYYYDNENVTDSHLAFRTKADAESMAISFIYEQSKHEGFMKVYGVSDAESSGNTLIDLGEVNTRQDRLLVFPNVFLHQVQPFELADKTKPGHRKILALFLVDPMTPVISTANVPPQQKHWGTLGDIDGKLPPELSKMVYSDLQCPYDFLEAKKLREELMEERKSLEQRTDKAIRSWSFSLCEH